MGLPAIVISGADECMKPGIKSFIIDLCDITEAEMDLILRPRTELALGKTFEPVPKDVLNIKDVDRVLHDIIRTKAQRALAMRHRPCQCVIIGQMGVRKDSHHLNDCKKFVLQEREAVAEWQMFQTITPVLLMSDYEFVRI